MSDTHDLQSRSIHFVLKHAPSRSVQLPGKADVYRDVPLGDAKLTGQSCHLHGSIRPSQSWTNYRLCDATENDCGKAVRSTPAEIVDV
ncbi:hypothetical protein NicSoilB8_17290 [Arthrobacter sp. NicSoilB8]|nr:hypothetical protein NicSoilB8_17290 [Arthrobacter sp. NicSoilB8]